MRFLLLNTIVLCLLFFIDTKCTAQNAFQEAIDAVVVGEQAPNFTHEDINGSQISLNQFLGKYVYIDFWATWCGPCIKETPYFEQLKKEYKGKDIVFLSVSMDDNKKKWREYVRKKEMTGYQLYAGGTDVKPTSYYVIRKGIGDMVVMGVPAFVIIDKEGKVVDKWAPRPSKEKKIRKELDELLARP